MNDVLKKGSVNSHLGFLQLYYQNPFTRRMEDREACKVCTHLSNCANWSTLATGCAELHLYFFGMEHNIIFMKIVRTIWAFSALSWIESVL